jgi:hypothetical protein
MGVDMYFKRLHAVYGCHNQGVERVGRWDFLPLND